MSDKDEKKVKLPLEGEQRAETPVTRAARDDDEFDDDLDDWFYNIDEQSTKWIFE